MPSDATISTVGRGVEVRTFLIADVRGYTGYTQAHGDDAASLLASRFAGIVRGLVPEFGGELVELRGDEALCVFVSARQAVRAAVELQRRLRTAPDDAPVFPLGVGMGADSGEAVPTEGGYRGSALNLASRLCAIAGPGQVLASEAVVHLAQRVEGIGFSPRKAVRLKGMTAPVRPVEIIPDQPLPPLPKPELPAKQRRRPVVISVAGATVLALIAFGVWSISQNGARGSASPPAVVVRPNSMAVINAATNRVIADVPMRLTSEAAYGASSPAVAFGDGFAWTYDGASQTLWRIDARTLHAQPFGIGITPSDLATSPGHVWVAGGHVISDRNPTSPTQSTNIHLPPHSGDPQIAIGRGGLWAIAAPGNFTPALLKIDMHKDQLTRTWTVTGTDVAADRTSVWVLQAPTVHDVFPPGPGTPTDQLPAGATGKGGLALGYGSAWCACGRGVWKTNATPPLFTEGSITANNANAIAIGSGSVWVVDAAAGQVLRINPTTNAVRRIRLGRALGGIAVGDGRVWVAVPGA